MFCLQLSMIRDSSISLSKSERSISTVVYDILRKVREVRVYDTNVTYSFNNTMHIRQHLIPLIALLDSFPLRCHIFERDPFVGIRHKSLNGVEDLFFADCYFSDNVHDANIIET